jgi:putative hydrolase of the HAD superfamily
MVKAVTFDFWDTLVYAVDYSLPRVEFMTRTLADMGYSIQAFEIKKAYIAATDDFYNLWKYEHRYLSPMDRITRMLSTLSIVLPGRSKRSICRAFEEIILEVPPPLVKNAAQTMRSIAMHAKIGLICDSGMSPGRVLRKVLQGHGLRKYFTSTVFSDEVGRTKPHASMFTRALHELGVQAQEAVHIGDLIETDMVGAKQAGMHAIWFNARQEVAQHTIKPAFDHEIHNLLDLPKLLSFPVPE